MGRLIDADKMLERLKEWNTKDKADETLHNFALHRIIEQPTAYDLKEVVKELEVLHDLVNINQKLAVSQAIDIVRKGGVK